MAAIKDLIMPNRQLREQSEWLWLTLKVRPVTAAAFIVEISELGQFDRRGIAMLARFTPIPNDSET